jgi:hypothetical protein
MLLLQLLLLPITRIFAADPLLLQCYSAILFTLVLIYTLLTVGVNIVFLWVLKHKLKAAAAAAAEPQYWQPQDMMHFLCKVRTKSASALCVLVRAQTQAEGSSSGSSGSGTSGLAAARYDALSMQGPSYYSNLHLQDPCVVCTALHDSRMSAVAP